MQQSRIEAAYISSWLQSTSELLAGGIGDLVTATTWFMLKVIQRRK